MTNFPLASVPATEVRIVHSELSGQDYLISVALPFHYEENPDKVWPVIYVLDGNWYFGMVTEMVRAMNIRVDFCNELPDAFIVGIGYPVTGSLSEQLHQVMHLRMRDFLPVEDDGRFIQEHFPVPVPLRPGNAPRFLQFIQQELVPLIDSEYRVDPANRTLLGHSWAGEFVLYTMFRHPQMFQQCVVADGGLDDADEQNYAEDHENLPVRLHLVGTETDGEFVDHLKSYVTRLENRGYADLKVTYQTIAHCTHCAVVPPAFQAGLVAVFS